LLDSGSGTLTHGYLCAWEKVELAGLRSRPVLAFPEGSSSPVAACPGYFYDLDLPTVRNPQGNVLIDWVRRVYPGFLIARTYELGSPTPLSNPFLVADPQLRPVAVRELIEAGLQEAEEGDAVFTLVQNFTSQDTPAGRVLAELGFAGVPILPTAVISLPYSSFEDYLGSMRAQYRRRAKQALKRSQQLSVEHLHDFAAEASELARLWRAIYDRATEVRRELLTPEFFRAMANVEQASVLLMRRQDGSIASFALLLDDGPWLSFLQCGFEETSRKEGAYFRLLYEIVRYGIENAYAQIDLGITTLAPKLDVGAVPVPLYAWLKHRNPLIQRVLMALAQGPLRPEGIGTRSVFKEQPISAAEIVASRELRC
jgi:predicted N-acyltransferase